MSLNFTTFTADLSCITQGCLPNDQVKDTEKLLANCMLTIVCNFDLSLLVILVDKSLRNADVSLSTGVPP